MSANQREIPIETFGIPKNSEWGPLLWQMLHGCAEKLGRAASDSIFQDQRREMVFVLRDVENAMPCPLCRAHYKEWRTRYPIDRFPETQSEFREAVRRWLWSLHQEVNMSRGFGGDVPFEALGPMYSGYDLKELGRQYDALLQRAIRLRGVEREAAKRFSTHYTFLTRIL
jgi:hypothetical protein